MHAAILIAAGLGVWTQARAEDRKLGWADVADFSFVLTSGNTENSTLGMKNLLSHTWEKSSFSLGAGAVRASSKAKNIAAVGTAGDFEIIDGETQVTTEIYDLRGRYDRKITDRFFWYVGAGWDRNKGAGVRNRYIGSAGVGNIWADTDSWKFRTDYALTYTKQKDYVPNPDAEDSFAGVRFSSAVLKKLGASTIYTNTLIVDDNLQDTQDYRADMTNAVAVAMSKRLALKVSLQWLYDHTPSVKDVDLFDRDPSDPAAVKGLPVQIELDSLDTIFTASLVVNF